MKPTRSNRFAALAVLCILPGCLFAADRVRNITATSLNNQEAWGDGVSGTPGASDRAVWNGTSVGGATILGGNASWGGILISSGTPSSGPLFTNAVNPSTFNLTLGASGIDLNDGDLTSRGISFESNTPISLGANQVWKLGNGQAAANIVVASVVSGASSLEITRSAGALNHAQLGGLNTFSGGLTIGSNAWLRLANAAAATTNLTTVTASATGTTTLTLNDGALVSSDGGTGRSIANTQINLLGNVTFNQATGGTGRIQMAGAWDLGGAPRIITVNKPSTSFGSGQEGLGVTVPANFTAPRFQNGALTIATTTGTATNPAIFRFTTSAFSSNGALTVGDGVVITSQNGSMFAAGVDAPALTLATADTRGGGLLQLGDGVSAMTGVSTMRSATVYSLNGGGSVSASNTTGTSSTGTLTVINGNNAEFSGSISQGGTGIIALTKSGTGTQTLSGTNAYTGPTIISGGTLRSAKSLALSTTASVAVNNAGSVLAVNYGGASDYTDVEVATLLAKTTFGATSTALAFDTGNAAGTVTYGNALNMAAGFRKLGAGTLLLNQTNTYTGGTIIQGGTLKITQPGGLGATGAVVVNAGTTVDADFSGLGIAGAYSRSTTGTGTIIATPPNASQFSFNSGTLTGFTGTINVRQGAAPNARVDISGLLGSGAILNIENGATARLALSAGIYSGITINVTGQGGSGPGALRLQENTLDATCAVNLLGDASIGSFTVTSVIDAAITDGGNGYSLTKAGDSTLVLTATNTYTGATNVTDGTLRISKPYLANSSAIVIGATAILDLNFDETGGAVTDTVSTLTIDGVQQAPGIYGATGSGATTINNTNFAGVGTLTVLNGPAPANTFVAWIGPFNVSDPSFGGDPDKDGVNNGVENILGSNPSTYSNGLTQVSATANSFKFRHNQSNTIATDVTKTYQWSPDLVNWAASGVSIGGTAATIVETTITDVIAPGNDVIEVTVTVPPSTLTKVFGRLVATKVP